MSGNCEPGRGLRRRQKNATEGGAKRFEKPAPAARAAPPEAHASLIGRKTGAQVPLTGLSFDVSGLAYSPKTGLLYATDIAWKRPEVGGPVRLDAASTDEGQTILATRIAELIRPTAIAFDADGALWVTLVGTNDDERGSVLRFTPGL